jgi:3',5'-cyclic AMP phosphodiesterase CpdA
MAPLRLAQISDFHFTKITWNPCRLFSKRILGNFNWLFSRKNNFSIEQINQLPPLLKSLSLNRILLGGDFTTTSLKAEYELAEKFVKELPVPWIAIPGNHDHYTYRAHRQKRFYRYFTNSCDTDHFHLEEHRIEVHRLSDEWWIIALDTSLATNLYSSAGFFSEKQQTLLQKILGEIPENGSILLFNHYPFFQNDVSRRTLTRGGMIENILRKELRIKAYLHGHSHRHIIANLQPSGLPVILDSGACADSRKGSWNLLELSDRGIKIDVYGWQDGWSVHQREEISWTR